MQQALGGLGRGLLWAVLTWVAMSAANALAQAQPPVKLVVPATAGGSLDGMARTVAQYLAQVSGQTVVVENRPGAAGIIGTDYVATSAPNGRTLLLAGSFIATNVPNYKAGFDPTRDLKPVIKLADNEIFLVVQPSLNIRSISDLKVVAQQRPGGLNCAAVPGQMALGCERLNGILGAPVVAVPYPGVAPAVNALIGGHVDLLFTTYASVSPFAGTSKLQVLAAAGSKAGKPPFHKLPLLIETWPGFSMAAFSGVFVAAGTAPSVVESLNRDLNSVLANPEVIRRLDELGYSVVGGSPEVLARTLSHDLEYYGRIATEAGVKPRQ